MTPARRFFIAASLTLTVLVYAALCSPRREAALPLCGELREQPCRDPR